jgi:hypothetical protein
MFKLVLVACLLVAVSAQIPIPSRYDGTFADSALCIHYIVH